jgi:hemerythrin-like metal-binding protein
MGTLDRTALNAEYEDIFEHLGRLYQDCLDRPLDQGLLDELNALDDELDRHFRHEGTVMAATGYPDAPQHEEMHGLIRRFLGKLAATAARREEVLFRQEVPFLVHLVLEHNSLDDRQFDRFLEQCGGDGRAM